MGSMTNRPRTGPNGLSAQRGASLAQAQVQELIDDITSSSAAPRVQTPPSPEDRVERERGNVNVSDAGKRFVAAGLGRGVNGHGRTGSTSECELPSAVTERLT